MTYPCINVYPAPLYLIKLLYYDTRDMKTDVYLLTVVILWKLATNLRRPHISRIVNKAMTCRFSNKNISSKMVLLAHVVFTCVCDFFYFQTAFCMSGRSISLACEFVIVFEKILPNRNIALLFHTKLSYRDIAIFWSHVLNLNIQTFREIYLTMLGQYFCILAEFDF